MDNAKIFNGSTLKWIAVIAMLIDHIGQLFFPEISVLRLIGRISFPIFAFLLTEGFKHTSDIRKYAMRLLMFAFISEVVYDYAFFGEYIYLKKQNIFFELFMGLMVLVLLNKAYLIKNMYLGVLVQVLAVIGGCVIAHFAFFSYGHTGIIVIICMYYFKKYPLYTAVIMGMAYFLAFNVDVAVCALLALIPILLYNGEQGVSSKKYKWLFYIFYPAHLFILALIKFI